MRESAVRSASACADPLEHGNGERASRVRELGLPERRPIAASALPFGRCGRSRTSNAALDSGGCEADTFLGDRTSRVRDSGRRKDARL